MMRTLAATLLLATAVSATAQHLPIDKSHSLESVLDGKHVLRFADVDINRISHDGYGKAEYADGVLTIDIPTSTGLRAKGPANDPDYAIYGTSTTRIDLGHSDLRQWNRLSMDVRTDLDAGIANINIVLDGSQASGLGAHLVNICGNDWQHVVYEIAELSLGDISALRIYTDLKGRNLSRKDSVRYCIRNIRLERVDATEQFRGWQPQQGEIAYSMAGYAAAGSKTAIARCGTDSIFRIVDAATDSTVMTGVATTERTTTGVFAVLDFSRLTASGMYVLEYGGIRTEPFAIGGSVWLSSEEKVLNFIRCMRCGDAVEGIHGRCHTDVFADHEGKCYTYGGGWHDAGDLSQQTLQTAEVAYALLEAYNTRRGHNPQLADRLRAEAVHGMRQVMRCRMGDGWHASSIGLLHWTDGIVGTDDDIHTVRKQNLAFDNFVYAAIEAYAAMTLGDEDMRQAAIEDFRYADGKYRRDGMDVFSIEMEHTYNTSRCTFMAAAAWAAATLYEMTHERQYADVAAEYADYVLACQQQQGEWAGYFFRDETRRAIVHYIHQSREQLPIQALACLHRLLPDHPRHGAWHRALQLYGNYMKRSMAYTLPYGMVPSGVYMQHEYDDADGFNRLHLWAPADAHEQYDRQLSEGVAVGGGLTLRRFPVWFSIFNGNEAILLSQGKAAAVCAAALDDAELRQIAMEQLYWTVGKNPFCQSLIYGEGHRYPSLDNFSSGEITGAMPVGIRSFGSGDEPYWPMTNNACYKEVWLTTAGKWLSLTAEME